jgi:hypothetical protein
MPRLLAKVSDSPGVFAKYDGGGGSGVGGNAGGEGGGVGSVGSRRPWTGKAQQHARVRGGNQITVTNLILCGLHTQLLNLSNSEW